MNKRCPSVALVAVATALSINGQTPSAKDFFQKLSSNRTETYERLLQAVDQIPKLSKAEAQDVAAAVFVALQKDGEVSVQAALGLYALAQRADSGEILQSRQPEIAAMLTRTDSRIKATATAVFLNMNPRPAGVVPILSNFILKSGSPAEKVDAVFALVRIGPAASETESAVLHLFSLSLDAPTRSAALHAVGNPNVVSPRIIELVAQHLSHSDEAVRIAAIQSISLMGGPAIAYASKSLLKLSTDETQSSTVRRLSKNVLEGRTENCMTLSGKPILSPCPVR